MRQMGSGPVWAGLLGHLSSGPEDDSWECPSFPSQWTQMLPLKDGMTRVD